MTEVVVVGAGLVGCLTALRLADASVGCVILDEGMGDRNASHASAGGIYLQLQPLLSPASIIQRHAQALAPVVCASFPAWRRLAERLPGLPLRSTGGLIVCFDDRDLAHLAEKSAMEGALGLRSELLSGDDIRRISEDFSPRIRGGCFMPDEGHCEPTALMRAVRAELHRRGVKILRGRRVDDIEQRSSGVRIFLQDGGHLDTCRAILATGSFTGELLDRMAVPHGIRAFAIQMFATQPATVRVPMLVRTVGRRLSLKQLDDGSVWVGGGWKAAGHDRASGKTIISAGNERQNHAVAADVIPGLASLAIRDRWGGWVAWTHDGLPILGPCPGAPDVFVACGGNGFSLAPLYGELLATLVVGGSPPVDLDAFRLGRFATSRPDASRDPEIAPD